ncbi:putative dehydrogenase [Larkinella arboricola]|uniref:Putative dehydrogenase n=1 Tax=Larkinella arboricola TaxID=643671 RepID=A0A327X8X3_LARAB|nr:Gfo/Idh/MocA family oxidoreductase [Larkinella arboricola]RAK02698.1 putative dehydrogenase [Larkinella arboricola]
MKDDTTNERIMSELKELGLGIIGFGGFGLFAAQHFLQSPHLKLIGIAGSQREEANRAAARFGATHFDSIDEMLARPDLDIVYIATPPFLHYEQSMQALRAGKHVICEKPLATNEEQGREMVEFARSKGLLMVTNLMQRYNPMFERIKTLIDKKILGEFLHGYFENYAGDEGLSPQHWFWNRELSGGIFIEHGVHFFDLFAGWLGDGKVEAAQVCKRPGTDLEDQVQATVRYGDSLVNFYHGFTQVGRMDRQEMRLLFERGDVTLHEWVPTRAVIRGLVDEAGTRALMDLFPGSILDVTGNYGGKDRAVRGRNKEFEIAQNVEIRYGFDHNKMHLYGELLRLMIRDQTSYLYYPETHRKITEQNGLTSLLTAVEADRLAHRA